MSKLFVFVLFLGLGMATAKAQAEFKMALHGGLPVGHVEKSSNLKVGGDLAYLFTFVDILDVGPLVGYSHYFIQQRIDLPYFSTYETKDVKFIPLAASGRVFLGENIFLGADAGYALALVDWTKGGIYYRPKAGIQFFGFAILISYEGINMDEGIISSANIGVEFQI